jgi:hypothetical protein
LNRKLDCNPHRQQLAERIGVARRLVEATQPRLVPLEDDNPSFTAPGDISRESRGLAIVLLFAAYENLLYSLCRSLLEAAARSRAQARQLKPGIQLFLVHGELTGLVDSGRKKLWKTSGPQVVSALLSRPARELNRDLFPDDGSFMKASQVSLFCDLFDLGNPAPVLREAWDQINAVVDQRNGIAHGRLTPEEVGRRYSHDEIMRLIRVWGDRWNDFLGWVEPQCQGSAFYLSKRSPGSRG